MIIKSIRIEIEEEYGKNHATLLEYDGSMWTVNGSLYPRVGSALADVVNLIRGRRDAEVKSRP